MRHTMYLSCVIAVVGLAGVAWATGYDDAIDGNWAADNADTWGAGTGVFPSAPADTAIIDEFTVTVPASYVIPTITSIDVQTGGTLSLASTATQTATITLNGGLLETANVQPMHGQYVTMTGTVNVAADSSITCADYWVAGMRLEGPVVSTAAGAHKVTVSTHWPSNWDNKYSLYLKGASPSYTGDWDIAKGWILVQANGGAGSGTVTIATGADSAGMDYAVSQTGVTGPAVMVNANGHFSVKGNVTVDFTNDPVTTLNGGEIITNWWESGTVDWNDPIHVAANSTINHVCATTNINGNLTGGAGVTLLITGARNSIYLNGDNSGFLGHLEVAGDGVSPDVWNRVHLYVGNGKLGGAADVTVKEHGILAFTEDYTSLPPVTAEAGGRVQLKFNHGAGATPFTGDLTLDGGILSNQGWGDGYASEMAGELNLTSDSYLEISNEGNADLVISGKITGSGKLTQISNGRTCFMSSTTSDWTGGTEVKSGTMEVTASGALSTGAVLVNGSGVLRTNPAGGPGASVLGACPSVTAEGGGVIKINSTEATTTKMILNPLGGLWIEGGATPMDYTPTGNIEAHTGAILHESIDGTTYAYPDVADIIPDGEGKKYLWKGAGSFDPGSPKAYTVGLGDGGVLKGLAAMSTNATMNANVTVTEHHAGDGFSLFSPGGTFNLTGPTFNGSGNVGLEGAGNFILNSANAFTGSITTLDYRGTGYIKSLVEAAMGAGQTLNIHDGSNLFLDHNSPAKAFGTSDAPADFANINVKSGGMIWSFYGNLTRGNVTVEDGAALYAFSDWPAGANLQFDPGSQLVLRWDSGYTTFTNMIPADGNASIVVSGNMNIGASGGVQDIVLGDTATLMSVGWYPNISATSGDLVLAPGGTQARVAATRYVADKQGALHLRNRINIPTGTLVVNGTGTFRAVSGQNQWTDYNQDGYVWLYNAANVIDKIDVQAGLLAIDDATAAPLGGADVHIAAGAAVGSSVGGTVYTNMTFSGGGLLSALNWEGNPGHTSSNLVLAGSTLNPGRGTTAGILTIDVNGWEAVKGLNFAMGGARAQIILDVVGDGGTNPPAEGVDYDRLDVQSMAGFPSADFTVRMPIPSVDFKPANFVGDTMTVLTTNMDLSSLTTGADGWASTHLDTIDDANDHWAGNINYIDGGMTVTDLAWTAIPGDADLDGTVQLSDLSILAFNWENDTGMTWSTADFDFDGVVNLSDLSILAFHWEETEAAGAPPVPEPMTVGLLLVGGVALLRRRRR